MREWKTGTGAALLGPGDGDIIVYMHNAHIVWMGPPVTGETAHIALLDYEQLRTPTVRDLKSDLAELGKPGTPAHALGRLTQLEATSIKELLKLDPFAAGADAALPPGRFFAVEGSCNEVHFPQDMTLKLDKSYESEQSSVESSQDTQQWNKGMLSFMNMGVDRNETLTTKVKNFRSSALS